MAFSTDCRTFHRRAGLAAAALALLAISACKSGPTSKNADGKSGAQPNSAATAQGGGDSGIDLNCVMDHIQNPPEAFHYSYNKESSNLVHEEADIPRRPSMAALKTIARLVRFTACIRTRPAGKARGPT